jgi:hypothetical protein
MNRVCTCRNYLAGRRIRDGSAPIGILSKRSHTHLFKLQFARVVHSPDGPVYFWSSF